MNFNMEAAIELYYSRNELDNADIKRIFGCSVSYVGKLKRQVFEHMAKENRYPPVLEAKNVNCEYAFAVWGLDIDELERKYGKLQKFRQMREDVVP